MSARTRSLLGAARVAGIVIVLVTGRRAPAARRVADRLLPELPLVLNNGALMLAGDGRVLDVMPLGVDLARAVVASGRRHTRELVVHAGLRGQGRLLAEPICRSNPVLSGYLERAGADVEWCPDLAAALDDEALAVMLGGDLDSMVALVPALEVDLRPRVRLERTLYPTLGMALVDIMRAGVTKATALRRLQRLWGIGAEETAAVGDNWNDREMLLEAGLGLVMGNADPALRTLGLTVLPSNDDDGVAFAIEHYILR